jgi:hypothetical protein
MEGYNGRKKKFGSGWREFLFLDVTAKRLKGKKAKRQKERLIQDPFR